MDEKFSRTEALLGESAMRKISGARVAVFGLGGVGGYVVEALARAGVGALDLIDGDVIEESNINRQILALQSTLGLAKTQVAAERVKQINPKCKVLTHMIFYTENNAREINFSDFDYVVDAIDTVSGKIAIAVNAQRAGVPVISCMGTGNKLDPSAFEAADISSTSVCPLARVMRRELKKRGVEKLKTVFSKEPPLRAGIAEDGGKAVPSSNSFVPPAAAFLIAAEVIKDLAAK